MHDAVRKAFVPFSAKFEGNVPWMYLDIKGLVTTGIGNLIDPSYLAMDLPFVCRDGSTATKQEIKAEWERVKARQDLRTHGGYAYRDVTMLRLTNDGIEKLVQRKLADNEHSMQARFIEWDEWPADAQLAVLSLCWACGPRFYFPKLSEALREQNFALAAMEIHIDDKGNPGVTPRNKANQLCLENAAWVVANGADRGELHWPKVAGERAGDGVQSV